MESKKGSGVVRPVEIENPDVCHVCGAGGLFGQNGPCRQCGFPQHGSNDDMRKFLREINRKKVLVAEYQNSFKSASYILYSIAVMDLSLGIFLLFFSKDAGYVSGGLVVSSIVIGVCGFYGKKYPLQAAAFGLLFFILNQAALIFLFPKGPRWGYWDLFVFCALIIALWFAYDRRRVARDLERVNRNKSPEKY